MKQWCGICDQNRNNNCTDRNCSHYNPFLIEHIEFAQLVDWKTFDPFRQITKVYRTEWVRADQSSGLGTPIYSSRDTQFYRGPYIILDMQYAEPITELPLRLNDRNLHLPLGIPIPRIVLAYTNINYKVCPEKVLIGYFIGEYAGIADVELKIMQYISYAQEKYYISKNGAMEELSFASASALVKDIELKTIDRKPKLLIVKSFAELRGIPC